LIISLFLPWSSTDGIDRDGWQLLPIGDLLVLLVGIVAIAAGLTGGRIGIFRPDLSLNAAADLLALVTVVLLAWLVIFDFPQGASREVGVFVALAAAIAVAAGVGDYRPLQGAPWFPRLRSDGNER
jgi:hypothetical protein